MNAIFKKLNFKSQPEVHIINAPDIFKKDMEEIAGETTVKPNLSKSKTIEFFLGFVTRRAEVDELSKKLAPLMAEDGLVWFAYPKASSKKYKCEFNRDDGWQALGDLGYEPVRTVAIDDDWSALRFRKAENIKTMMRTAALSEAGKKIVSARKGKRNQE